MISINVRFLLSCIILQMAEGVEFLLKCYPDYVTVDDLPLDTVQERVTYFSLLDNIFLVIYV